MAAKRTSAYLLLALIAVSTFGARALFAQGAAADPNLANPTRVITAKRDGYTIAALVTHLDGAKAFKYGIALFPGHPGIMRLREEDGAPLVTVRGGGPARGPACMAFTQHGFVGAEIATVRAMRDWVKTGAAPAEIRP